MTHLVSPHSSHCLRKERPVRHIDTRCKSCGLTFVNYLILVCGSYAVSCCRLMQPPDVRWLTLQFSPVCHILLNCSSCPFTNGVSSKLSARNGCKAAHYFHEWGACNVPTHSMPGPFCGLISNPTTACQMISLLFQKHSDITDPHLQLSITPQTRFKVSHP